MQNISAENPLFHLLYIALCFAEENQMVHDSMITASVYPVCLTCTKYFLMYMVRYICGHEKHCSVHVNEQDQNTLHTQWKYIAVT